MKISLTSVLCLFCACVFSQPYGEATINGNFPKEAGKVIVITGPNHFTIPAPTDRNGEFKVTFNAKPGYYLIRYANEKFKFHIFTLFM
jgi:hypothetical protein